MGNRPPEQDRAVLLGDATTLRECAERLEALRRRLPGLDPPQTTEAGDTQGSANAGDARTAADTAGAKVLTDADDGAQDWAAALEALARRCRVAAGDLEAAAGTGRGPSQ